MQSQTIAALIAAQAESGGDAVALRCAGRAPLTYAGLRAATGEVVTALHDIGLARGDRVAIVLPNGPEMAVAFLGVGSAMVCAPLNPRYREDDFAFSFGDLGVKALIADPAQNEAAIAAARRLSVPILALSPRCDAPAGVFTLTPERVARAGGPDVQFDDVALVLHTSGTTARPKIVLLTHRNLCASADNIRRTLELTSGDVCLNVMPLFHIHGLIGALLSSLAAGASVDCGTDPRGTDLLEHLRRSAATWYTAVPTIHQSILEAAERTPASVEGHRLRLIRSSSSSLPPRVMLELSERFDVPVLEAYGMTEAAHQMASNPLGAGRQKPGSVGLPAGPQIAVLGEAGRVDRPFAVGEIVIRGETVSPGYEDRDATAAAFVDGWFRTGDQGYFDDEGYLVLTGRLKELINRGGEKIAPREVEEALMRHPAVAQAVAFAVPSPRLGEEVGAAVVLKPGAAASADELRQAARGQLSYFKVPSAIKIVEQLPTGPTGKLQRSGLAAALDMGARPAAAVGRAPETALESRLAIEWMRLLRVTEVGLDDDFFALGGDSFAATELMMIAEDVLQAEIPFDEFLERPTIGALIELGERARSAGDAAAEAVALQSVGDGAPIFSPPTADNRVRQIVPLLRHLGRQRPVYGLRAPVAAARELASVEDLAAHHMAAMLRIDPRGPHHLIGAGFGGVVAFEMARQLERAGRPVGLLVLIDSLDRRRRWAAESHGVAAWQARAFDALATLGLPRPAFLRKAVLANHRAEARYRPGRVAAGAVLVHAMPFEMSAAWRDAIGGPLTTLEWPGPADELWRNETFLSSIAKAIQAHLA